MMRAMMVVMAAVVLLAAAACAGRRGREGAAGGPVGDARQLVLVVTPGWDAVAATLRRFERDAAGAWRAVGGPVPAVVGRTGLAWGDGLLPPAAERARLTGPVKREGDGRAPAGAFRLGAAFGFAPPDSVAWLRLPYRQVTADFECVDDAASRHYNQLVHRSEAVPIDWASSERMRTIDQYRFGLVVDHNAGAGDGTPRPGGGSCIFLHIWAESKSPGASRPGTAGCTAFAPDELVSLLRWLDPAARPVLVQLPDAEYERLRAAWGLP